MLLAITPKKYLHDVMANHTHIQLSNNAEEVITASGFNCQVDNLVVNVLFDNSYSFLQINNIASYCLYNDPAISGCISQMSRQQNLRGPPFLANI